MGERMVRLVIEDDEGKTTVVPLIRDEITIGRQEGNTIRLTERNVSRRHARLLRSGTAPTPTILVEDLDSYNGVRINGDRIHGKCRVQPGDLIQIGDYALALRLEQASQEQPAAAAPAAAPAAFESMPTAVHQVEPSLEPAEHGRMVVISSNLAGETFHLSRRELIVGRSSDNDLVVNHRSISRNHAKIVYREGSFTIIDLASSNGVRVNGTEFGTHTLVNGDIVELGHVKLRFVAAGDDYAFSPADIDDVELAGAGSGRIIVAVVVLLVVALAAYLIARPKAPTTPAKAPVQQTKAPTPKPVEPAVNVETLLAEGKALLAAEKWTQAAAAFGRVARAQPDHPEVADLRKKATSEAESKKVFNELLANVDAQRWQEAYLNLEHLSQASVYYPRVSDQRDRIQTGYARHELRDGIALIEGDDLDEAKTVQKALAQKKFARKEARALAAKIREAERRKAAPEPRPEVKKPPKAAPVKASRSTENFDALMNKGRELQATGRRSDAARQFEKAHRLRTASHAPHQQLCSVYKRMGQFKKALHHCKMWLAKDASKPAKKTARRYIADLEAELNP